MVDREQCLTVEHREGGPPGLALGSCAEAEDDQFTTTGTGPIHWAAHPGQCFYAGDGGDLVLRDCLDVVTRPEAQFIAPEAGYICLLSSPTTCLR